MGGYYVYMHIAPNNKKYIGITKQNPKSRWKNGYGYASSPHFYNAILKYGWDNIEHIILASNLSLENASEMEKELIAKYNLTNRENGYNECSGGEGTNGYHHTEEFKEKLRNRPISEKQKLSISNTVKKRWQEGVYNNREYNQTPWNKGLTKDDPRVAKYCRKVGEFNHSEEAKKRMSESHKGKPAPNRKQVECVETGVIYNSAKEATNITGINNISKAARFGNSAGKLHWRYIND